MSADESASKQPDDAPGGITEIAVQGFKSLYDEQRIAVRPLTILAGANNSGKSSIMQPLLMLKQTLDATYDPGPLKLDGPNVYFTSAEQFLSGLGERDKPRSFTVELVVASGQKIASTFSKQSDGKIELIKMVAGSLGEEKEYVLQPGMSHKEIVSITSDILENMHEEYKMIYSIDRERCFLNIAAKQSKGILSGVDVSINPFTHSFQAAARETIHVPRLRGEAERTYKTTAVSPTFPGTFENYIASVIGHWQVTKDDRLGELGKALRMLGLTWKVEAKQLDDVHIELRVGRLPQRKRGGARDLVSLADVGFGVSQVLPVVVALLAADPGQLVYVEQPELHLHPKAQVSLAQALAAAAKRGVRVVVETHSSLLLLGVQTLVAGGTLPPDRVALHWFKRGKDGATTVTSADLDEAGAFGNWPEDFGDVDLQSESCYLDAAESVLWKQARAS